MKVKDAIKLLSELPPEADVLLASHPTGYNCAVFKDIEQWRWNPEQYALVASEDSYDESDPMPEGATGAVILFPDYPAFPYGLDD